jgi:hypothetical protein
VASKIVTAAADSAVQSHGDEIVASFSLILAATFLVTGVRQLVIDLAQLGQGR